MGRFVTMPTKECRRAKRIISIDPRGRFNLEIAGGRGGGGIKWKIDQDRERMVPGRTDGPETNIRRGLDNFW